MTTIKPPSISAEQFANVRAAFASARTARAAQLATSASMTVAPEAAAETEVSAQQPIFIDAGTLSAPERPMSLIDRIKTRWTSLRSTIATWLRIR